MRKIILIITITFFTASSYAQTAVDALRYSRLTFGGTARYMALNGAFGALGADFTTLSTNPAGIGLYKRSELTITPSLYTGGTESTYLGESRRDYKVNFNLGNVGLVLSKKLYARTEASGWRYVQVGLGLNRLADFNNRIDIRGYNENNSLLDVYSAYANDFGIPYEDIEQDPMRIYQYDLNPAWWTFLLDLDPDNPNQYVNPVGKKGSVQSYQMQSWGSMNEFVFSLGANYKDLVYIGATFGIPYIRYFEESNYEEFADPENDLSSFSINRELETRASGFNFKFGMIVRPVDWLRFGAALHTPTFYNNVKDYNRVNFSSQFKTPDTSGATSYWRTNAWNRGYQLTTPMRAIGSIGFIIGKYGLVSGEYEYANYSMARFHQVSSDINNDIDDGYDKTHNFRVGTEWRAGILYLRGGYAYYASPYRDGINDGAINSYSGGLGVKIANISVDLTYVYSVSEEDYYLYGYRDIIAKANNKLNNQRILLTFGTTF